jgi:integrase
MWLGILLKDFPNVTPHDLRHTAASLAVSAGGNVLSLARMLGHASSTRRSCADDRMCQGWADDPAKRRALPS